MNLLKKTCLKISEDLSIIILRKGTHPKPINFYSLRTGHRLEREVCSLHNKHAMRASINQPPKRCPLLLEINYQIVHNDFTRTFLDPSAPYKKQPPTFYTYFFLSRCGCVCSFRSLCCWPSHACLFPRVNYCTSRSRTRCSSVCETQSGSFSQRRSSQRSQLKNVT